MYVFKKLEAGDVIISPITVNKAYVYNITNASDFNNSSALQFYNGVNKTGSFNPASDTTSNGTYDKLLYDSLNQLFFQANYSGSVIKASSGSFNLSEYRENQTGERNYFS
jgi:hypothetical protein